MPRYGIISFEVSILRKVSLVWLNRVVLSAIAILNAALCAAYSLLHTADMFLPTAQSLLLLAVFSFIPPFFCLIGILYAAIWATLEPHGYKRKYVVWIAIFAAELIVWGIGFARLVYA